MAPKFGDYEELRKPAPKPKPKKGYYHNYSRDDLKRAGLMPIDERGKLLKCLEERGLCFYDNYPLSVDVDGQITVLKKCNQCGTIYYCKPSKDREKPVVLTEAIGTEILPEEPPKPSELEIKAEEEKGNTEGNK